MSSAAVTSGTLSAEEYWALPDDGRRTELVRGKVLTIPSPGFQHGELCLRIGFVIMQFLAAKPFGRIVSNDAGVITERDPDTVRGPALSFYSFDRLPSHQSPQGYPDVAPDLSLEVKSPSDRWNKLVSKAAELLDAGVTVVCIVDPESQKVQIHRADEAVRTLARDEFLEFADVLPGFSVRVGDLFR
jgi:Uma2 family endonuclease